MAPYVGVLRELLHETRKLRFLKPTSRLRRLLLLSELRQEPRASQRTLADRAGVSVSVANQYLSGFLHQGLATRRSRNRRDHEYALSAGGGEHLSEEVLRYLREVFVLSSGARNEIALYLKSLLQEKGIKRLAIYPAGEVAETILHVIDDLEADVVGVVDDDAARHGTAFQGRIIQSPAELPGLRIDAVLVATYQHRVPILAKLDEMDLHGAEVVCL